jgi:hypothetical protein
MALPRQAPMIWGAGIPYAVWVVTDHTHTRAHKTQNMVFAHDAACAVVHDTRRFWLMRSDAGEALRRLERLGYQREPVERMTVQPGGAGVVKTLGLPYDCIVYAQPEGALLNDLLTAERFVARRVLPEALASVVGPIPAYQVP